MSVRENVTLLRLVLHTLLKQALVSKNPAHSLQSGEYAVVLNTPKKAELIVEHDMILYLWAGETQH